MDFHPKDHIEILGIVSNKVFLLCFSITQHSIKMLSAVVAYTQVLTFTSGKRKILGKKLNVTIFIILK